MVIITEERLFSPTGTLLARTKTPHIERLRAYRQALGSRVASMALKHIQGQRMVVFHLHDGRIVIAVLGYTGGAVASPTTPVADRAIAAD